MPLSGRGFSSPIEIEDSHNLDTIMSVHDTSQVDILSYPPNMIGVKEDPTDYKNIVN